MSAHASPAPLRAPAAPLRAAPRDSAAGAPPALLRLLAFFPLALFGALHWAGLVTPRGGGGAAGAVFAATAAGLVLVGLQDVRDRRVRAAALTALMLALFVVALRTAGVDRWYLAPAHWDDLAAGLRDGISGMPSATVPYRGADAWVRATILLGGTLSTAIAALLAFWPERASLSPSSRGHAPGSPMPAAVALTVLYTVPIVEHGPRMPWLGGALFCLLLSGFLWLERLRADQVGAAAVVLTTATAAGLVIAPRLDATRPWLDYQALAEGLEPAAADTFSWNHRYGPMTWPRDGREVVRVRSPVSAYWKATNLDQFDGIRWREGRPSFLILPDTEFSRAHPEWFATVRVEMKAMRSREFIGAGTTLSVLAPAPDAVRASWGTWVAKNGTLNRGTSYDERVYVPKPTETDMRTSGTDYPDGVRPFLSIDMPQSVVRRPLVDPGAALQPARPSVTLQFPVWSDAPYGVREVYRSGYQNLDGAALLRDSAYRQVWTIAQRLRAQSGSPYQFVTAVRDRVQKDAVYSESPQAHKVPLASFLTSDPVGYCQQFSGAMALLLRMGGVPARVASGFSPGRYDRTRNEYVVRDLDAHSWVEVYFPGIGWTTWDPTPSSAPANRASAGRNPGAPSFSGASPGDRPDAGSPSVRSAPGGGVPGGLVAGGLLLTALLAGGAWTVVRRGRLPDGPLGPEVAELQRALHRSGRTPSPQTTLTHLERTLGATPAARDYLRAVRAARYAGAAAGPTPAQRRALRQELAAGLGLRGRLRALWALPPRARWTGRRAAGS